MSSIVYLPADIETSVKKKHIPLAIGIFDGKNSKIFSIKNKIGNLEFLSKNMILEFFKYVAIHYNNVIIYFHNLSSFDGYLLLEKLALNYFQQSIIIRDNKIYQISLTYLKNSHKLIIKDSYLMIPLKLKEASFLFNKIYFKKAYPFANFAYSQYNEII